MCRTTSNFEKFQNTLNLIYTVRAMSKMMILTVFAIVSTMRITGVEISKQSKYEKQTGISKSFKNTVNLLYTVCAMSEMMIQTMFAIVKMMRITGVEISKKSKYEKQTAISKSFKTL